MLGWLMILVSPFNTGGKTSQVAVLIPIHTYSSTVGDGRGSRAAQGRAHILGFLLDALAFEQLGAHTLAANGRSHHSEHYQYTDQFDQRESVAVVPQLV